jgi:hypothetical protein
MEQLYEEEGLIYFAFHKLIATPSPESLHTEKVNTLSK